MKIAHLTDLHLDEYLFAADTINGKNNLIVITEDIRNRDIEKIVITGDMGNHDLFDWVIQTINKTGIEYTYILGNHDKADFFLNRSDIRDKVRKDGLFYHWETESDLFLFLDSSFSEIGTSQIDWIEYMLGGTRDKRVIVFTHYPILNCGDSTMDRLYPLLNREFMENIFKNSGKNIYIFSGHYHTSAKVIDRNIKQYVTPSAVLQFKKYSDQLTLETRQYGYRIIDIGKESISTEVILFDP